MQSHPTSIIQLAEIRHNEFQAEATRFRLASQARAPRPSVSGIVATARRRCWLALGNAAVRLPGGAPTTVRGDAGSAVPALRADSIERAG